MSEREMPKCPRCHTSDSVSIYGLPAGVYPASFRCFRCNPDGAYFGADQLDEAGRAVAERACNEARATSKANAEKYRQGLKP